MAKKEAKHHSGSEKVHHCTEAIKSIAEAVCSTHCELCEGDDSGCEENLSALLDVLDMHVKHLNECCGHSTED